MKVAIRKFYSHPQEICVLVDGECNHADYSYELDTWEYEDERGQVTGGDNPLYTCNRCGAWRSAEDDESEWEGITFLPMRWR